MRSDSAPLESLERYLKQAAAEEGCLFSARETAEGKYGWPEGEKPADGERPFSG